MELIDEDFGACARICQLGVFEGLRLFWVLSEL